MHQDNCIHGKDTIYIFIYLYMCVYACVYVYVWPSAKTYNSAANTTECVFLRHLVSLDIYKS